MEDFLNFFLSNLYTSKFLAIFIYKSPFLPKILFSIAPWPCFMGAMVSFPYEDITYVVKNTFFLLELSVSPELIEISMSVHRAGSVVDLAQGLSSRKLIFYWGLPQLPVSLSLSLEAVGLPSRHLLNLFLPAFWEPNRGRRDWWSHCSGRKLSLNPCFPCGALPLPSALPGVFPKSRVPLLQPLQRIPPVFSDLQESINWFTF